MTAHKSTLRQTEFQTRRRDLKRLALVGAFVVAPAILGATGCQTMKDTFAFFKKEPVKESKTVDDVLSAERPSW
ncbi:MAG: hypothetical protein ACOX0A_09430 [Thermoguttaceae bacterium]|jgi:hypothetical protein